jgi:hypothetical protein
MVPLRSAVWLKLVPNRSMPLGTIVAAWRRRRSIVLVALFAISIAGCANNPPPREVAHPDETVSQPRHKVVVHKLPALRVRRVERIRQIDASLLAEQPAPDCEYARTGDTAVDPGEWTRLKLDYEKQCYKAAEEISRNRLRLLQQANRIDSAQARSVR